jgi:biotin carboxylase
MLAAVAAYVERRPVDLIIPIQERMIVMAGQVAEQIERLAPLAPMPDSDLCGRVDDKWTFHQMMWDADLPVPRATLATSSDSWLSELGRGSPLLLKPRHGVGGVGIRLFEGADDLLEAIDGLPNATREGFIIQEYIPGRDIDCNLLAVDGEIIAHTVQRAVLQQARAFTSGLGLEFVRDESVAAVAARFAEVSRWTGVAHLDMRIDSRTGQPVLIEVNPRYWQTLLGSLAMGTNFPDIHCRLAFGRSPAPAHSRTGFYLEAHSVLKSPRNFVTLMRHDPGFLRYIDWGIMVADPRVEISILLRHVKLHVAKAFSYAGRICRRALGGRGRSSQLR